MHFLNKPKKYIYSLHLPKDIISNINKYKNFLEKFRTVKNFNNINLITHFDIMDISYDKYIKNAILLKNAMPPNTNILIENINNYKSVFDAFNDVNTFLGDKRINGNYSFV